MPPSRPLPSMRDVPPPPDIDQRDQAGHDAARRQAFAAQVRAERDAHEPLGEAARRADQMIVDSRRYIRRLIGGAPFVQGVWPGIVLHIDDRVRRWCTVRLTETGAVLNHVQYDPTPPVVGGQYAVRRTVRLNMAAERGAPEEVHWTLKVPGQRWLYWLWAETFPIPEVQLRRVTWPPTEEDRVELVATFPPEPGTILSDYRLVATTANTSFYVSVQRWSRNVVNEPATLIQLEDWGTGDQSRQTIGTAPPPGPVHDPHAIAFYLEYDDAEVETPMFALYAGDMSPTATQPVLVAGYTTQRWTELATTALNDLSQPTFNYFFDFPHEQELVSLDGGATWTPGRQMLRRPAVKVNAPGAPGDQFSATGRSPLRNYIRAAAAWSDGDGNPTVVWEWHHATPEPTGGDLTLEHTDPLNTWSEYVDWQNFLSELHAGAVSYDGFTPGFLQPPSGLGGQPSAGTVMAPFDDAIVYHEEMASLGPRPGPGLDQYFTLVGLQYYRAITGDGQVSLDPVNSPIAGAWDGMDLLSSTTGDVRVFSQDAGDHWDELPAPLDVGTGTEHILWDDPEAPFTHAMPGVTVIVEGP